jgi:hypothetical protein
MKLLLGVLSLVCLFGLTRLQATSPMASPEIVPAVASIGSAADISSGSAEIDGAETNVICPLRWTCNYRNWYSTQAACSATSCGATCELDYRCGFGCVCP